MNKLQPQQLWSFFWQVLRPHRSRFILLLTNAVLIALVHAYKPFVVKDLVDIAAQYTSQLTGLWPAIMPALLFLSFLYVFQGFQFRLAEYLMLKILPPLKQAVSHRMFAYLNRHSYAFFQDHFAGSLANKVSDMSEGLGQLVAEGIDMHLEALLQFIFSLILLAWLTQPIFAVLVGLWGIVFLGISAWMSKKAFVLSEQASEQRSVMQGKLVDSLSNMNNVRLFGRHRFEVFFYNRYLKLYRAEETKLRFYIFILRIVQDITIIAVALAILWLVVYYFAQGRLSLGDITAILTVTGMIIERVWWMAARMADVAATIGKCKQAFNIIHKPHEIPFTQAPKLRVCRGEIVLDQVSFSYVSDKPLFHNLSLTIKAGEKVGLVGYSGSGKTTLTHLLLRHFDVQSGRILIDGQDISKIDQISLRQAIALIPQDTSLFHRSLQENIAYGRLEASDQQIKESAVGAYADEFIASLPQAYASEVGERGIKLSGGQRQRIAIARALLKDAPILILDEATSALDSLTEQVIQESFSKLMAGRTTIVVAHRLSTLLHMDRILVFDQGRLIEEGKHQDLLQVGGHYAKLWNMQSGGFLPEHD